MDQSIWKRELTRYEAYGIPINIYLVKGIKLRGHVHDHDDVCLLFDGGKASGMGGTQLIRYTSIATIVPEAQ